MTLNIKNLSTCIRQDFNFIYISACPIFRETDNVALRHSYSRHRILYCSAAARRVQAVRISPT